MASYFDEHDTEEHGNRTEREDMVLFVARRILESGQFLLEHESLMARIMGGLKPPPTAKWLIKALEDEGVILKEKDDSCCPICLKEYEKDDTLMKLPCQHIFHPGCIKPWLTKTSSCPVCRHPLPTDDPTYEEIKRQKERREQRQKDIESLHDSMFG